MMKSNSFSIYNKLFNSNHTVMSKERDIEILEYKIDELEAKIIIYEQQDISQKKIDKLVTQKGIYENQLAVIEAS